jgi:hypothetical protein
MGFPKSTLAFAAALIMAGLALTLPGHPAQAASVWYYCANPAGYYPTVSRCNVAWREVPAQLPPGPIATAPSSVNPAAGNPTPAPKANGLYPLAAIPETNPASRDAAPGPAAPAATAAKTKVPGWCERHKLHAPSLPYCVQ